jgi:hypothetical protein
MTDKEKYLLLGGIVLAAGAYWWYTTQQTVTAATQIQNQTSTGQTTTSGGTSATTAVSVAAGTTAAPSSSTGVNQSELQALLTWSNSTKNPALYQQMMNQLTAAQVDGLYQILTGPWATGASPTPAQTTFWNGLVTQYPFLRTGGAGCTTLACT